MAISTKVRGKKLYLTFDGVTYDMDVKTASIVAEEGSPTSGDLYHALYMVNFTADASDDENSLFQYAWENPGLQVEFALSRLGNTVPELGKPHYIGLVEIGRQPEVSYETHEWSEFECSWEVVGPVTKITAPIVP